MMTTGRQGKFSLLSTQTCFFREPEQGDDVVVDDLEKLGTGDGRNALYCRHCNAPVTSNDERLNVLGKHCHSFPNPEGIVFEIGCFGLAPGCLRQGNGTTQYSWFPPYAWSFALCKSCKTHLGWFYETAGKPSFFGLILDRLIEGLE